MNARQLLDRLTALWQPRPSAHEAPALDPRLAASAAKVCSAAEALAGVKSGDHVFIGTACATPRALLAALDALTPWRTDLELLHFLTDRALALDDQGLPTTRHRHRCFFVGQDLRAAVRRGLADYVPVSAARVPQLIAIGRIPVDVALIQVSMPDEYGYVSLGVSVDVIPAAVARARLVVAEVNPAMPRTMGDSMLHIGQIHHLVPVDTPVIEYRHPDTEDAVVEQIARYIGGIIDDGSTLQIGPGRYSHAALAFLADRQDLGVHTDVVTDAILPLIERGVITGRRKTHQAGKIVASLAMGSRRLYDLIDRNPLFSFQPLDQVADPAVIARQHKMVSVTQAFAVDLTGQVCADQFEGGFYGGLAAQAEFLQGASRSPGGKAIICLASREADGGRSCIRATLAAGEGATIARSDVHYVITEYGIAYLFGRSIRERAVALIQIAHPDCRAALLDEARALGYVPPEQALRNLRAYAVQDEHAATLKDGRQVLVRPAQPSDGDRVRDLFHRLPERDVYTRFFRKIKGLSLGDVQRLCNLDDETEVALVAVTGDREQPQVVGHALYVVDPSTNLAETAFMVHPDWQGSGLGALLQRRLAVDAQGRGVRGFVAEILATNERMLRLARSGAGGVEVENLGGTVKVTTLF
jgi:acyl-CoA hydrolase/GNAT superfamily N-acetyltransferase